MGIRERKHDALYIACEDMDFVWFSEDIKRIRILWQEGKSVAAIAKAFNRDPDELAILLIDLARNGRIGSRPGGVLGY